jgi:hypothetical protein
MKKSSLTKRRLPAGVVALGVPVLLLFLGACTPPPAFVYNKNEFNRNAKGFGRPATDIKSVTICYAKGGTTPRQVAELARAECSKFNKKAVFKEQNRSTCPLTTPIAVQYVCQGGPGPGLSAVGARPTAGASPYGYDFDFSPPYWFYGSGAAKNR